MAPFEALALCAEIAIGITGFSGVVLVFRERDSERAGLQPILFRTLFTATLIPLGLIAVAFVMDAAAIEPSVTWRICSAIHALAVCATASLNFRDVLRARRAQADSLGRPSQLVAKGGLAVLAIALLVIGLQVVNAISLHAFWPFLVAVWWGIAVSLFAFVGLLFAGRSG